MRAADVFLQNNGDVTKAYYAEMSQRGPAGLVAVALFRAQKRSTAAKRYRGGHYRRAAYDVKNWSIGELVKLLLEHGAALGIIWGWKRDPGVPGYEWVLYVDLPEMIGQCSFHSAYRLQGPDYSGGWDGTHFSAERIIAFCDSVAAAAATQ
jgi:hypothetical protein